MERKKLLKWIELSRTISLKHPNQFICPNDKNHEVGIRIKDFPNHSKREQELSCEKCNVKLTFTIEIPNQTYN